MKLFQRFVAEAGADMADIAPIILLAHCKGERSKWACSPWSRKSNDDDFLPLRGLDLEPIAGAGPDRYWLSARFAMMPSRPLRSASSKNFLPDVLR
jgi:hypothetical protein